MPFKTATPNNAIKPIPALILNGIPLNRRANTPPIADNGIAEKINKLYFTFPKAKYSINKISIKAMGNAMLKRFVACCKFSY